MIRLLIGTRGRYGLKTAYDLALKYTGEFEPLKNISERQNISLKYLEQIIRDLRQAGIVVSFTGMSGGYKLAKHPSKITVLKVLEACEGKLCSAICGAEDGFCVEAENNNCTLIYFWRGYTDTIRKYAEKFTLQDLLDSNYTDISGVCNDIFNDVK